MEDAALEETVPPLATDRGVLGALAFCAPWLVVSLLLPEPTLRYASLVLVASLGALLAAAARWSWKRANERGLDAERWSFFATVTFGFSMIALLLPPSVTAERALTDGVPCIECGRVQLATEPFCFSCGAS